MKKFLLLVGIAIINIISCSKKEDENSNQKALIGTWAIESISVDGIPVELNNCHRKIFVSYTENEITMQELSLSFETGANGSIEGNPQKKLTPGEVTVKVKCDNSKFYKATYTATSENIIVTANSNVSTLPYKISGNTLTTTDEESISDKNGTIKRKVAYTYVKI